MDQKILAFAGRRYSGKDKASSLILEMDYRFQTFSFAGEAKEEFCQVYNLKSRVFEPKQKEMYRKQLIEYAEEKKEKNQYYWAERLFKKTEGFEAICISDLRFIPELEMIVKRKGIVYKVFADPEVRKYRGWVFDPEIDNSFIECEMDLSAYTFNKLTGGGVIFNNERDTDVALRGEIFRLLNRHFPL